GNAGRATRHGSGDHAAGGRARAGGACARAHARAGWVSADGSAAPRAAVAVDVALFTVRVGALHVLLVQVRGEPFAGWWALPGGRVHDDESLDAAAARELEAQTAVGEVYLEQLYSFGNPQRDPHDRVVSVAYVGLIADLPRASPPGPTGKY